MTTHVPDRPLHDPSHGAGSAEHELLDPAAVSRTLARLAHELLERAPDLADVVLVGIHTRGVPLALRLQGLVAERSGLELPVGALDITLHRDDVARDAQANGASGGARSTSLPAQLAGRTVVLVDDVLSTGRTVRAAIDTLLEHGRPARIEVAVLVDRGHRELPIRPDYVGKNLPTARDERVQVRVREVDGVDQVVLQRGANG